MPPTPHHHIDLLSPTRTHKVVAGCGHTLCIVNGPNEARGLVACGRGERGQLGTQDTRMEPRPCAVKGLNTEQATHKSPLTNPEPPITPDPPKVVQISGAYEHAGAVTKSGEVYLWGRGDVGTAASPATPPLGDAATA